MHFIRRFRIPAIFCALAVLICELIAHPYTTMGVCDDGPYIIMAHTLATTGHIVYNGWAAPMLGWQLYLAAAFIKLFGFSFTAVRMGTIFVAMLLAFVLQRTLVAANISERNATLATLAFVLSPLYLMLSATFMTDIYGLFAIVICLYACLRALQSTTNRNTLACLLFAILSNAICGTSRQIGWLGILVMVPSTLYLLRSKRPVLLAGILANLAGILFIVASLHWLKLQPYSIPEHLVLKSFSPVDALGQLTYFFLDASCLLLPITALFLPEIRRSRPRVVIILSLLFLGYLFLALYPSHLRGDFPLQPCGEWVNAVATFAYPILSGNPPAFLHRGAQALLTLASVGGLLGLATSLLRPRETPPAADSSTVLPWKQLRILLVPFTLAYFFLLVARGPTIGLHDRYLLAPVVIAVLCLIRYYQEQTQPRLPLFFVLLVGVMAIYSIAVIHDMFAFYRARVALAAELHASNIPDTSVDNGWEYNLLTELQYADHINQPYIVVPVHAYVPPPPLPPGTCRMNIFDYTPHIHPLYGVSFDPDACYGPAPFAPVPYSRWPYRTPGTLYVVRYTPDSKP